ncbi:MAG: folylpolyglutamate synthase/dihydrofolate synthase family protein [Succiniclasticum sp.]|uniref:bifunctional folylpolyglutamate synthase/dihydrofolate synthase n=1 Tax=Succiniclasticum sp. TaxID=2775030 RepID=UPI002A91C24A|nr:folylpolyglutamate synthase/dihydrofolate synthase family protein [Succiniclasticum sp.]MDY6289875.1 folylpolyglutamate synthase/dihydrofolate synthase family protein [Succiniclasticum sp.]
MNYQESIAYLESLGQFGIRLGMERIQQLLFVLGHPENQVKTVHVAGTNGKGSVTTMISTILTEAGLRVGKFTSPHLVRYNERIQINEKEISDEDFAKVLTTVRDFADDLVKKGACEQPTQFEILTAAAFHYFAISQVDYAIIEVGLGGLWDSTNLIKPLVSVITNVALDHTKVLGSTLEEIALQKAGIIKENVPVVTGASGRALPPIQVMSAVKQAPIYVYGQSFRGEEVSSSIERQAFLLKAGTNYTSEYEIQLPGVHQIANASLAIVAVKIVSKQDARITEEHLHRGAARTKWPGRLEKISSAPDVILDGAHNPDGAEALRNALDKYYPEKKRCFVFGMMADKDVDEVIRILFRPSDTVFTVRADEGPRAAKAEDLAERIGSQAAASPVGDVLQAYTMACTKAGTDGIVCVCGSLYLVGTFKAECD